MTKVEDLGLYDIYPLYHIPFWQGRLFYTVCTGLLTIIVLFTLYLLVQWLRKRKRKVCLPWETALMTLNTLERHTYTDHDKAKQCYFTMTGVLKNYLITRYMLKLDGSTDKELITYLKTHEIPSKQLITTITTVLNNSGAIKFANQRALHDQVIENITACKEIIQATIPRTDTRNPTP